MNKINVKIVVGANYGDEGKGLASSYFSSVAKGKCLTVLYNGGSQRGHTVELKNGYRHVFHHLGSGTVFCSDSYFDKGFILNPISFRDEFENFKHLGIKIFVNPNCMVSTLYDMMINQIVELNRNSDKHGSCGYGIWETQRRYDTKYSLRYKDLIRMKDNELFEYIKSIANDYFYSQMDYYKIHNISEGYNQVLLSDMSIIHYINDLRYMQMSTCMVDFRDIANLYPTIVFEAGQGLALSENNIDAYPYTTPSDTGSSIPLHMIKDFDTDIEICYVTRSYFTRHGAGPFPTECSKSKINDDINDFTNVTNQFQDSIRYGTFCKEEFLKRISKDKSNEVSNQIKYSLMITHLNYTKGDLFGDCKINDLCGFNRLYLSDTKYCDDIKEVHNA